MTLRFHAWQRSKLLSASTAQGGRLGRSLALALDDLGDGQPARNADISVLFPAAADVIGIRAEAIRHLAPRPSTPDAETTKLVHLDFHEPDLPWRYTPLPSVEGTGGLKPWIVLLVGTADELDAEGGVVTRLADAVLKDHRLELSDRWAHVQAGNGVTISRLLSPRRLVPLRAHVAAIVPAFTADGGEMWTGTQRHFQTLPAFFSWRFQTGEEGDFETLATALRGRPSAGLGIATLRYERPVVNVTARLTLGGAITSLKVHPGEQDQVEIARADLDKINDDLEDIVPPGRPRRDIVQLPNYGGLWHEDTSAARWTRSMNDDPRHRGVAGLGLWMGIVEQEALMDAAVTQAGALGDASQRVSHLAVGIDAARRLWRRRLPEAPELRLRIFGPAMGRMLTEHNGTILHHVTGPDRTLDAAMFSSAAQRLLRNGTARARFAKDGPGIDRPAFFRAANNAPPPVEKTPPGLPHVDAIAAELGQPPLEKALGLPEFDRSLEEIVQQFEGQPATRDQIDGLVDMLRQLSDIDCSDRMPVFHERLQPPPQFLDRETIMALIENCLQFSIGETPASFGLGAALPRPEIPDDQRPVRIDALADAVGRLVDPTVKRPLALVRMQATMKGIDISSLTPPEAPIGLDFPTWSLLNRHEREWLLPGAGSILPNSVVAMQTNPTFIDCFMVGINTQFLAEMRWRNLPAPRVSTPLRMFWGYVNHETGKREADIRPIAEWPSLAMGDPAADDVGALSHQAVKPGDLDGKTDLVIAFRTSLFRRYPSTLVYLVRPQPGDDVDALLKQPPNFSDQPTGRNLRRFFGPIFFGQMEPDLVFFAFDLNPGDLDRCWVVLDEPPSELRFRSDLGMAGNDSADFADRNIDTPTRVAISGAVLEQQAQNG